jgi:phosphoglycerate dehydrogenase-like enzyme
MMTKTSLSSSRLPTNRSETAVVAAKSGPEVETALPSETPVSQAHIGPDNTPVPLLTEDGHLTRLARRIVETAVPEPTMFPELNNPVVDWK